MEKKILNTVPLPEISEKSVTTATIKLFDYMTNYMTNHYNQEVQKYSVSWPYLVTMHAVCNWHVRHNVFEELKSERFGPTAYNNIMRFHGQQS